MILSGAYHKRCIHCGSDRFKRMERYVEAALVRCQKCKLVFSERIPTADELAEYYRNYGLNSDLSPITRDRYKRLLYKWEPYRDTNRILDVGCGVGHFLEIARELNWEVYGTELSEGAYTTCISKGIKMHHGLIEDAPFDAASFDIVVSIEVIEHINTPGKDLEAINNLLRPGGLHYITTPNFGSLSSRILKDKYNVVTYPEHLTYYTPKTLHRVLIANGFRKRSIVTDGIIVWRLLSSVKRNRSNAAVHETRVVGTRDEALRERIEHNPFLRFIKSVINGFLNLTRLGDAMKASYEKR